MVLSEILRHLEVEYHIEGADEFDSLGLASYNNGDRTCTFIESEKFIEGLSKNISVVITKEIVHSSIKKARPDICICTVDNPRMVFFNIHQYLKDCNEYTRETYKTQVGKNCNISSLSFISPENVLIGNNVTIEEFCSIKPNTIIGDNSIIRAGSIIGTEGYEVKVDDSDRSFVVKHLGGVIIGTNVEIQSNCCICKALYPWDNTVIGNSVKIDNLVHIAHGVKIGDESEIVTHAAIGGRTSIGENAWVGIGAIIKNGLVIGDNTRVNMGAVVTKDVPDGNHVSGNFAIEHSKFLENLKKIR